MIINIKKHLFYYLSLLGVVGLGIFLVLQTSYDKNLQSLIAAITVFFYIFWGSLHHYMDHDLTAKIVIEYILIGSLGMTIALFLLKGGI